MSPLATHALAALGGFAIAAAIVLYPALRSAWQQRNDPAPLARWSGGRMPAWPKGMHDVPGDRAPVGPSLPRVVPSESKGAAVVAIGRPRGAA